MSATTKAPMPLTSLPALVQDFFQRYLPIERNATRNTILSYRDALKLLLRFTAEKKGRAPDELSCEEVLDPEWIRAFLRWLAEERKCRPSTRNQRLAALRTFARFVAARAPEHLERCRQIRELPRARCEHREVEYLEENEIGRLCKEIDPDTARGLRDRALILLLYNTGARASELCALDVSDLRLEESPRVRLMGKGRKERICPLWTKTVSALKAWLQHRRSPPDKSPLFLNAHGRKLTRSGLAYLLRRLAVTAGIKCFQRTRRITPHVFRHTTAMHMLQAKIDLTVISSWLGHAQLSTTHAYLAADLRMRQEAIAGSTALPEFREGVYPAEDLIGYLENLGRRPDYAEPVAQTAHGSKPPAGCST